MLKLKDVAKSLNLSMKSAKTLFKNESFQLTESGTIYLQKTDRVKDFLKTQSVISEANRFLENDDRDSETHNSTEIETAVKQTLSNVFERIQELQSILYNSTNQETVEMIDGIIADSIDLSELADSLYMYLKKGI